MGEMSLNGCASYAGGMVDVIVSSIHVCCRWWWPRVLGYVAALSSSCDWVECIGVIFLIDQL